MTCILSPYLQILAVRFDRCTFFSLLKLGKVAVLIAPQTLNLGSRTWTLKAHGSTELHYDLYKALLAES